MVALLASGCGKSQTEHQGVHWKNSRTKTLVEWIAIGSDGYKKVYGRWPTSLQELAQTPPGVLFVAPQEIDGRDGWGHELKYQPFDPSRGFGVVTSYGRDGKPGGTILDQDVTAKFNGSRVK